MNPELVITRGLPASGKTTWARAWVANDPARYVRVSRDDIRAMLFDATDTYVCSHECQWFLGYDHHEECRTRYQLYFSAPNLHIREAAVTAAENAAVRGLLENGRNVVVDDTNLRVRYIRQWAELAVDCGVDFRIQDFSHVDVAICVERDAARGEKVGGKVIHEMAERFKNSNRALDATDDVVHGGWRYVPDTSLPKAWIVDIDGTLADKGYRSPYDYTRVSEDTPFESIVRVVRTLGSKDWIVVVSGRESSCRSHTEEWLNRYVGLGPSDGMPFGARKLWHSLHMRTTGDKRSDEIVKMEILRDKIAPNFYVLGVLDDRNRVVRMWRRVGLTCLQVADGAF